MASEAAALLGVLSSQAHVVWALAAKARLGIGNDPVYNKSTCFECFPFPVASDEQAKRISALAEQLDAHRKRQQAAHPGLTLTGMYNVLEKLRSGEVLSAKERTIHEQGLVSVLRQIHDDLDAAVLDAYGWSDLLPLLQVAHDSGASPALPTSDSTGPGLSGTEARRAFDEAVLERLVALNAERAAEEARGLVRWLRPEFQNPQAGRRPDQGQLVTGTPDEDDDADTAAALPAAAIKPVPWQKDAVVQVRAIADVLDAAAAPLSLDEITARFSSCGAWKKRVPAILDMLVTLGRARQTGERYQAA